MTTPADPCARNRGYAIPDKILLATNLEDAEYLLPHAIAQARASGAKLTLVHVLAPLETLPLNPIAIPHAESAATEEGAKRALEAMAAKARSSGVTCDVMVSDGSPQRAIPELMKKIQADRLILGTHGRRRLARLLLGSAAQEILDRVEAPVCTIGPHAHTTSPQEPPRKILHPVSFRPGYEQSACLALDIAQFYQAEITLLHVIERTPESEQDSGRVAQWAQAELERLIPDEALLWTYVNVQVEVGKVVEQIMDVAVEMPADLIVLGVDKNGSIWPIHGDRSAYGVIAQAKCPVLTARHDVPAK
jgi:nucleotide-binding universal stress UspA family protein